MNPASASRRHAGLLTLSLLLSVPLLHGCRRPAPPVQQVAAPPAPVPVQVAPAAEQPIPRHLRVTGQLLGLHDAIIAADANGRVVETPIERGSRVPLNGVLARIDDRNARLALQEAEATLALAVARRALAQSEVDRNTPLLPTRAIAPADFRRLEAELAVREADLAAATTRRDQARKQLEDCTIRSPFAGIVAERHLEPGQFVRPDSPVARVVDTSRLRLVLNIPETLSSQLRPGLPVTFQSAAFPGETFAGELRHISAALRESARDLVVEAEVPNPGERLRPGLFAEARIELDTRPALAIPRAALHQDGNRRSVFLLIDNHLVERLVEVGESSGTHVEIRNGLRPTEPVVIAAQERLLDGAPARIVQP